MFGSLEGVFIEVLAILLFLIPDKRCLAFIVSAKEGVLSCQRRE